MESFLLKKGETMNKFVKKMAVLLSVPLLSVSLLTGCGGGKENGGKVKKSDGDEKPYTICMIVEKTANMPDVDYSHFQDELDECFMNYGTVSIIEMDGKAFLVERVENEKPKNKPNPTQKESNAKKCTDDVFGLIEDEAVPNTPEVDVIGALVEAGHEIEDAENAKIIVVSNGLMTTGSIRMQESLLVNIKGHKTEWISRLEDKHLVPDFSNVSDIDWYCMGDASGVQQPPTEENKADLKDFYTDYLTEAGISKNNISIFMKDFTTDNEEEKTGYPEVSPVEIIEDTISEKEEGFGKSQTSLRFDESQLPFVSDQAVLKIDQAAARERLEPVITYLKDGQNSGKVMLIGTCAKAGSQKGRIALSRKRAAAIKSILVKAGCDPSMIETVGVGWHEDFCCDEQVGGKWDEEVAVKNRAVIVTMADSSLAQKVKKLKEQR